MKKEILALLLITLLTLTLSMVHASTFEHITVRSEEQESLTVILQANQMVEGNFNISGAEGHNINFWVRNPSGSIILDSGTVVDEGSFSFTADTSGGYVLNFENTHWRYNRGIDIEYDVSSLGSTSVLKVDLLAVICIVLLISLIVLIIAFAIFYQRTKRKAEPSYSGAVGIK